MRAQSRRRRRRRCRVKYQTFVYNGAVDWTTNIDQDLANNCLIRNYLQFDVFGSVVCEPFSSPMRCEE